MRRKARGLIGFLVGIALLAAWTGALAVAGPSTVAAAEGSADPRYWLIGVQGDVSMNALERHVRALGMEPQRSIPLLNILRVRSSGGSMASAISSLERLAEVAYVEEDVRVESEAVVPDVISNDPYFARQWALDRIRAPEAWELTTGSDDVIIAVVDSGVATQHPDLASRLWINEGEVPGNGLDDDGNGYVDDASGWRFFHDYVGNQYVPAQDATVEDDYGHGTHVSGILAAATNNDVGVSGVTWHGRLMPVKVLDEYGAGWYSDIAEGITYAVENGASIINLSLGGSTPSQSLCAAVDFAVSNGALVVAATGNAGSSVYYPAACSGALAVAAVDSSDQPASFSNSGSEVAIAAPGALILSTWPWRGGYYTKSGTSMAAPFVSGAAALVQARWPALTAAEIQERLLDTAADIGAPGWDPHTGWGRLDLAAAVGVDDIGADLSVSADLTPDPVLAGRPITVVLTVANSGPAPADGVTLTVHLPSELPLHRITDSIESSAGECERFADDLVCPHPHLEIDGALRVALGGIVELSEGVTATLRIEVAAQTRDPLEGNNAFTLTIGPAVLPSSESHLRCFFPWIR